MLDSKIFTNRALVFQFQPTKPTGYINSLYIFRISLEKERERETASRLSKYPKFSEQLPSTRGYFLQLFTRFSKIVGD